MAEADLLTLPIRLTPGALQMLNPRPQPISEESASRYLHRAALLHARARREGHRDGVEWLSDNSSGLRPATFRQYKAALMFSEQAQGRDIGRLRNLLQAKPATEIEKRTSAKKHKRLPGKQYDQLRRSLGARGSQTRHYVDLQLHFGKRLGARPGEWPSARLDGQRITFENAKCSQGRSHGRTRTLILSFSEQELARLTEWLAIVAAHKDCWTRFQNRLSKALHRENKALFRKARDKTITLYSSRHQFAANQKATGRTKAEVTASMGHRAIATATRHYGRRRYGRSVGDTVRPDAQDVKRVESLNATVKAKAEPAPEPEAINPVMPASFKGPGM